MADVIERPLVIEIRRLVPTGRVRYGWMPASPLLADKASKRTLPSGLLAVLVVRGLWIEAGVSLPSTSLSAIL